MTTGALAGRRILVPESRELVLFTHMLEKQGATVLRCPLVTVLDLDDTGPVEEWLGRLIEGAFDDLVLYTGEGVTRLLAISARIGTEQEFTRALTHVRIIARGPKPTRALRQLGLSPHSVAQPATTAGVIEALRNVELGRRRIGVQGYPDQPPELGDHLRAAGAVADVVVPYRYAADREDERVVEAIRAMAEGAVDLVAFTSRPQVRRLHEVAERSGLASLLSKARDLTPAAAIGPVTAEALAQVGWPRVQQVEDSFHLKPLVSVLVAMAGVSREAAGTSDSLPASQSTARDGHDAATPVPPGSAIRHGEAPPIDPIGGEMPGREALFHSVAPAKQKIVSVTTE